MTTQGVGVRTQAAFELPPLPKEFGKDEGQFYRCYDAFADDMDDDMVKGLKEQLDGILIFAGLFAGVNSGFLALTLPLMQADPADDTNALLQANNAILLQLALGRSDNITSLDVLPSETFRPSGKVLITNVLFSVSLTFAIISSFMAVLGRQWLYEYGRHSGGGVESQRWKRLQRFLATKRWHLAFVLDDLLPSILQFGLVVFCISLTIYLSSLHPLLSKVVGIFMGIAMAMLGGTAVAALWDPFCPFQTPLSRAITTLIRFCIFFGFEFMIRFWPILWVVIWLIIALPFLLVLLVVWLTLKRFRNTRMERRARDFRRLLHDFRVVFDRFLPTGMRYLTTPMISIPKSLRKIRKEESIEELHAVATERVLSRSSDVVTLVHTISNVLTIGEPHIKIITTNNELCKHLVYLCRMSYSQAIQLLGRDQASLASAITWRYRAAVGHAYLSSTNPVISLVTSDFFLQDSFQDEEEPGLLLPSEFIQNPSTTFVDGCLGYLLCIAANNERYSKVLDQVLQLDFEGLLVPNWRRICMIIISVNVSRRWSIPYETSEWLLCIFQLTYVGEPRPAIECLGWAMSLFKQAEDEEKTTMGRYLTGIFKVAVDAVTSTTGGSDHPSVELDLVAKLLHLSEDFARTPGCPHDYLTARRDLRRDLIASLHSGLQASAISGRKLALQDTIDALIDLLADLTAVGGQLHGATLEDDIDLAFLLMPLLKSLDEISSKYQLAERENLPRHVNVFDVLAGCGSGLPVSSLSQQFQHFTSRVSRASRHINRRQRDPDLQWCHRQEEVLFGDGYDSFSGGSPYSGLYGGRPLRNYGFWTARPSIP